MYRRVHNETQDGLPSILVVKVRPLYKESGLSRFFCTAAQRGLAANSLIQRCIKVFRLVEITCHGV